MARDSINVHLPVADRSNSVEFIEIEKQSVTQANGIEIKEALRNKNNSLQISVENTANSDNTVIIRAGNNWPNAILGDLTLEVKQSAITVILLEDISRFENRDGSIYIDFGTGFTGNIWAVAKRAGLQRVAQAA